MATKLESCVGEYSNHKWGEDGTCIREGCTVSRTAPISPGTRVESLESIAAQLESAGKPKDSKWANRKAKAAAEQAASRELAKANAKTFVQVAEGAKRIAFRASLGLEIRGLTKDEESGITANLSRVLELLEYDISNPKVALALFLMSYAQVSYEQYQDATMAGMEDADTKEGT